ncbi:MAG: sulfite exporter TauE/SafE family protein [Burkholderiales bacterium]|nr:sulfite exporter TauE/SafE family protein [Burkholderiales bacterium]
MAWGLLLSSLMLGVLGGVHCTAMCAGMVCSLCGSHEVKSQFPLLCGRLFSYTAAGTLLGGGASFLAQFMVKGSAFAAFAHIFQGAAVVLAMLMLLAPHLNFFQGRVPLRLQTAADAPVQWAQVGQGLPLQAVVKKRAGRFYLGLLWVGLPCGLLQAALMLAWFSGSAWLGGLSMAVFALVSGACLLASGQVLASVLKRWPSRELVIRRATGALLLAGLSSVYFAGGGAGQVGSGDAFFCLPQF